MDSFASPPQELLDDMNLNEPEWGRAGLFTFWRRDRLLSVSATIVVPTAATATAPTATGPAAAVPAAGAEVHSSPLLPR